MAQAGAAAVAAAAEGGDAAAALRVLHERKMGALNARLQRARRRLAARERVRALQRPRRRLAPQIEFR